MSIFAEKKTIIQNMTFMAVISAINIIISVLTTLISGISPLFSVILIIALPLTSTIVEIYCKDRYFPIYALASIGLSIVATIWNFQYTIFYLVPSVFTGYIFGLLIKKKLSGYYSILIGSLIQTGFTYLTIPLLNIIYETNFIDVALDLLNISESSIAISLVPFVIYALSLIQVGLSYFIVFEEMTKLGIETPSKVKNNPLFAGISLILCLISLGLSFVNVKISLLILGIALYVIISVIIISFAHQLFPTLISVVASIILSIILFSVFYPMMEEPQNLILFVIFPILVSVSMIFVIILNNKKSTSKIDNNKE